MLFGEMRTDCTGYSFPAPAATDAPKGCWRIFRVVLSNDTLDQYFFDSMDMVRKSVAGSLFSIAHRYGVQAVKNDNTPSADVLLEGSPAEIASFLAGYARGSVFRPPAKYHRIG